jgi:hypothetical protein
MKKTVIIFIVIIMNFVSAAPEKGPIKKFVLEEQKVEGKIRRPQLVLVKADQRPSFTPLASQSFGTNPDIVGFVDKKVLDYMPCDGPFMFANKTISGYQP